jgi:calmodulin
MKEDNKLSIQQIDTDQILTEDEKRACKECFDAYDKLGYGTLEAEEL